LPTIFPTATPVPLVPANPTEAPSTSTTVEHTVQAGETLTSIAIRYGTTVEAIRQNNGLTSDVIFVGQKLTVQGGTTAPSGPMTVHVVSANETLFAIALRYGVTVEDIKAVNGLGSDVIYVGQQLNIPGTGSGGQSQPGTSSGTQRYHTVQLNETLLTIALKYGVTVEQILQANGLSNPDFVWVGQRLLIP
jgi:LysM repeat protein